MDAVDVFGRIDRVDDRPQRKMSGQRHLDDDPGDCRVLVEALDLLAERVRGDLRADLDEPPVDPHLLAGPQELL